MLCNCLCEHHHSIFNIKLDRIAEISQVHLMMIEYHAIYITEMVTLNTNYMYSKFRILLNIELATLHKQMLEVIIQQFLFWLGLNAQRY